MADISEAFNTLKFQKKPFQVIDYFFTQRNLTEEHDYLDKNMNRKTKKIKVTHNFLALNIPTISTFIGKPNESTNNTDNTEKSLGFDIEIFGDDGYHYKGTITSFQGIVPNFMIPIKGDKKLFVNINYNYSDSNNNSSTKNFVNFIEVPKRFQISDDDDDKSQVSKQNNEENTDV
jgi:hypothetical protein